MVGKSTTERRSFVRLDCDGVAQLAAGLIDRVTESDAARIGSVVQRVPDNAERAVMLEQSWMRSSLATTIRRDLLDLHYYAMLYRERELADACGRTLHEIDRRAQEEASPVFNPLD